METIQYKVKVVGSSNGSHFDRTFDIYERTESLAVKRAIEVANIFIDKCQVRSIKILKSELKVVA